MNYNKSIFFFVILSFFLLVVMFSCAKKSDSTLNAYIRAHNSHDVEKTMSYFASDARYDMAEGWTKTGLDTIRAVEEFDAATNSRLSVSDVRVKGDTVFCKLTESNDFLRLAGVKDALYHTTFFFKDRKIVRIIKAQSMESRTEVKTAFKPFTKWASEKRFPEWARLTMNGEFKYGYEGAEGWITLLKEWKEAAQDSARVTSIEK